MPGAPIDPKRWTIVSGSADRKLHENMREVSSVRPIADTTPRNPGSRELLNDIRQDAMDYMLDALRQAQKNNWVDAMLSADIAHDRLLFAEQLQEELDLYT